MFARPPSLLKQNKTQENVIPEAGARAQIHPKKKMKTESAGCSSQVRQLKKNKKTEMESNHAKTLTVNDTPCTQQSPIGFEKISESEVGGCPIDLGGFR